MLILIIFSLTNIIVVGTFMAIYGRKPKYIDRMLLGVHIPPYAVHDPEVEDLITDYKKKTKQFYIINGILSIAVCFLNFWYVSIFMIFWSFWLLEFIGGAFALLNSAHRKLYDLKVERGWQGCGSQSIVVVDTTVSAKGDKLPFSIWWHLPILLGMIMMGALPSVRRYLVDDDVWIISGISFFMSLFFVVMHVWTMHNRNEVFSQNTHINKRVNQTIKRVWSMMWIVGNYLNLLSLCVELYYTSKTQWLSGIGIAWFVIIQSIAAMGILGGFLCLRWKKQDLLKEDVDRIYLDDDVYWKNGWYNNPNSSNMWAQDRMNSMNYTVNMGHPGGKICMALTVGITVATLVGISAFFLEMDFAPRYLTTEESQVYISVPSYPISFEKSDIKDVELLLELPKGDYKRTNGLADGQQLVGKFKEKDIGQCRLYIYRKYSPVLKIELEEYTVFINSKQAGQTEQWYDLLIK